MKLGDKVLAKVLQRASELVEGSEDSAWTPWDVAEILSDLDQVRRAIESGGPVNRSKLELLFMATGPIQEVAVDNGWGDEMLRLAEVVDRYIEDHRASRPWWRFW